MSINHYENFPVASFLCPPALRPAVASIYWFARTADDIADEGTAPATQRLSDLADFRRELTAAASPSGELTPRWAQVFIPLRATLQQHQLPLSLLTNLLSAFEQDVVKTSYADRAELLDYCRRSANPVGRLLLHLYGVKSPQALQQSDAICSALQLANFWQDLSVDTSRGRLYIPATDCVAHQADPASLLAQQNSEAARTLIAALVDWTRSLMLSGASLVHAVPGRAGWELRLVVQGGLRILDKIAANGYTSLNSRPVLRWFDFPSWPGAHCACGIQEPSRTEPQMTPEQYVQEKAASSGSSFYYAFLFLPPPRRAAITAFYAFCREVDDVVDEVTDPSVAATKLAWWRREVAAAFSGHPTHPVTKALMPHSDEYAIKADHLLAVIEGCQMDLDQSRYLDYPGLARYCHLVAGVVGEVAASIFGRTVDSTITYAHRLGLAMQLTNIIRDVGDDARRGRIYLPMSELKQFDVKANEVLNRGYSDRFTALMKFQAARAHSLYEEAFALLPDADRASQKPGVMMANIYRTLLREIEADNFQVLHQRTSLTPLRKLWIAMRTNWRGR